jgi:integrating conjugative element protein (TIGR03761 family)
MATKRSVPKPDAAPAVSSISQVATPPGDDGLLLNLDKVEFLTDPDSPFADKYSVGKEQAFLAEFIAAGRDESDPLYDRYIELVDRQERLDKMRSAYKSDLGADSLVSHTDAAQMRTLGPLVSGEGDDADTMEVHTREAHRMFMGRRRDPDGKTPAIIGGQRIANVLRSLWFMTGDDNPYADWALVRHEHAMTEVAAKLEVEIDAAQALIGKQKERGISLSILRNAAPANLSLGFRSPYGFACASFINRFDYYARLMHTLKNKDLVSDAQMRQSVHEMTRNIRRVWSDTYRFDRWLVREEVAALSRADFVEGADEQAAKRVDFVTQMFGTVPSQIYTCAIQPRHSRRLRRITPQERALIASIGQKLERDVQQPAQAVAASMSADAGAAADAHSAQADAATGQDAQN